MFQQDHRMNKLGKLVKELERRIPRQDIINPKISTSSVGWHIEHSLLTIDVIIEALKRSDPSDYKWTFSFTKILVFSMNKIPRGRAQSPAAVRPRNAVSIDTLKNHLYTSTKKMQELQTLRPNNYFVHPFFGKLNVKPAIKFIEIHTEHHIKIIEDILVSR